MKKNGRAVGVLVGMMALMMWFRLRKRQKKMGFEGKLPREGDVIGHVAELNVYPAKSCKKVSVEKARVTNNGLEMDRVVMVVNRKNVPITQRMHPELARIEVECDRRSNEVVLKAPEELGLSPLRLSLGDAKEKSNAEVIDLHSLSAPCVSFSDEANAWMNDCLSKLSGRNIHGYRLVCLAQGQVRKLKSSPVRFLTQNSENFDGTYLSDLCPVTLISEASTSKLNSEIKAENSKVDTDRFRSNVILSCRHELAFLEDHVEVFQIGGMRLRQIGPTFRCVIPSVDQETGDAGFRKGVRNAEPISTLRKFRSGGARFGVTGFLPTTMGGSRGFASLFGVYLGLERVEESEIRVGDAVKVLKFRKPPGIFESAILQLFDTFGIGPPFQI